MVCQWRDHYLESGELYSLISHLLSIIQVPLGVFGALIVYYKTPRNMEKVRFIMMALHLTSVWLDVYLNILVIPYTIFPASSGFPLGLALDMGVPYWVMVYVGFTTLYFLGCTLMAFFEDRYNSLVRREANTISQQRKRLIFYIVNYSIALTAFLHFPTHREAREIISRDFPCLPSSITEKPGFFMLTTEPLIFVASLSGYLIFCGVQAIYFISKTSIYLFKIKAQSQRISQMQKQLFKSICIQTVVPILLLITPCLYMQISAALHYLDMILGNISMIWLSTYGIFSVMQKRNRLITSVDHLLRVTNKSTTIR